VDDSLTKQVASQGCENNRQGYKLGSGRKLST
jgi:hypothetical protein